MDVCAAAAEVGMVYDPRSAIGGGGQRREQALPEEGGVSEEGSDGRATNNSRATTTARGRGHDADETGRTGKEKLGPNWLASIKRSKIERAAGYVDRLRTGPGTGVYLSRRKAEPRGRCFAAIPADPWLVDTS